MFIAVIASMVQLVEMIVEKFSPELYGNLGIFLFLTCISGKLNPVETILYNEQETILLFSFSGIQNTSRAGVAVPVVYGEIITGSVTISAGVDTEQVQV